MKRTTSKIEIEKREGREGKINTHTQERRQHTGGIRRLSGSHAARGGCSTETKEQNPPPRRAGKRKEKLRRRCKKQTGTRENEKEGENGERQKGKEKLREKEKGKGKGVRAALYL